MTIKNLHSPKRTTELKELKLSPSTEFSTKSLIVDVPGNLLLLQAEGAFANRKLRMVVARLKGHSRKNHGEENWSTKSSEYC